MSRQDFEDQRLRMVATIKAQTAFVGSLNGKAALDDGTLEALAKVPRHEFVPIELQAYAYANTPVPIGFGKTISQPFIVAVMTDLLDLQPEDTVLEIGTGLGYQTAILAELSRKVCSVEIVEELGQSAEQRLKRLGYGNIELRIGNGCSGWPDYAPFEKMMVTAAPDLIPPTLIGQLKAGGRMVIPVGLPATQQLVLAQKQPNGRMAIKEIMPVRFSELEGTYEPGIRAS